jgi:hypothetical protein
MNLLLVLFVSGFDPKIRIDVGRCLPHMWGFIWDVCGDIWGRMAGSEKPC